MSYTQQKRYEKLRDEVSSTYKALDNNKDIAKHEALCLKWIRANKKLVDFCYNTFN